MKKGRPMSVAQEVLATNENFYQAFNRSDLDLMQSVWAQKETVVCIHPGWEVIRGFDTVISSWESIFVGSENLEIKLSDIKVTGGKGMVWGSCQENLFAMSMSGVQVSKVHATNLFEKIENNWKMVLHHASSIPQLSLQEQISTN
jgi:ketosteroid isomerase-like protein